MSAEEMYCHVRLGALKARQSYRFRAIGLPRPNVKGSGYLAGEFPGGTTTIEGAPVSATVRVLLRAEKGDPSDGVLVAETTSNQDGTWIVKGIDEDLKYDVVGRAEGFNDVIASGITPTSMIEIAYSGAVVENETFTGTEGYIEIVGGIPPYSVAPETPLPFGLFPVVSGRNLIIDGTTDADEVASFDVKVTSSNGAEKIIPLQLVVGFKAPANFKAETVVVDDVFSVALTWEVTNSTQQIKVYRSATPFDLDDLPEPIATLSGTSTTYTDDDVIEDDLFYYMVTAVCEQYDLRSDVIVENVVVGDPHWDKVVALLHFDESLYDQSGKIWSPSDNAPSYQESNDAMFGHEIYLRRVGARVGISTESHSDFNFGTGDFTIEFYITPKDFTSPWGAVVATNQPAFGPTGTTLTLVGGNEFSNRKLKLLSFARPNNNPVIQTNHVFDLNVRVHFAITRNANTFNTFINGAMDNTSLFEGPVDFSTLGTRVGSNRWDGLNGYVETLLDEFRVTKGVARYTENFTPPTKPFPNK